VTADDHAAVLKVWSKRHRDLGRARNQVACRLHAVLCELRPGGISNEITAAKAAAASPASAAAVPVRVQPNVAGWSGMVQRPAVIYVGMGGAPVARRLTWRHCYWGGPVARPRLAGWVQSVRPCRSWDHGQSSRRG
jgi:hypothetical protein